MIKKRGKERDPLAKMFAELRPNTDELAKVKKAEGDPIEFVRLLGELDRKYKIRSLDALRIDKKLLNRQASRPVTEDVTPAYKRAAIPSGFAVIERLLTSSQLVSENFIPFKFKMKIK